MAEPSQTLAPLRRALQQGALLLPAKDLGTLTITGKDRQTWLNGIATCDLAPLKPGQGAFGLAVSKTGKILAPLYVLIDEQQILVGMPKTLVESLQAHLDRHIIMEDVELEDTSESITWAFAHGPAAKDLVATARALGAIAAAAVDTTGKGGALLAFDKTSADEAMVRLAKPKPTTPIALADEESWEALRVEIGVPRFGKDFTDENYPQEASIETLAVSFQKGCYLGQEAVFMLQARGHVKKKLMPLSIEGSENIADGADIKLPDGTSVGIITSTTTSPTSDATLALGFVKYKHANAGTALSVNGRNAAVLGKEA